LTLVRPPQHRPAQPGPDPGPAPLHEAVCGLQPRVRPNAVRVRRPEPLRLVSPGRPFGPLAAV